MRHTNKRRPQAVYIWAKCKNAKIKGFLRPFASILDLCKMPKNSINQMVKCAKKLINLLTKCGNMLKGCLRQRRQELGVVCMSAYYVIFQFSHTYICPFLPDKLQKDYKMFSMWLQNRDKARTQNTLCNFSKSPHICKLSIVWLGALCGLCIFVHI